MAPKRPGEIISGAFATFGANWQQLILFSLAYVAVTFVLGLVLGLVVSAIVDSLEGALIAAFVGIGVFLVVAMAFTGALTRLVACEIAGAPTTITESIGYGMRHLGSILLVSLLIFAIMLGVIVVGALLTAALDSGIMILLAVLVVFFIGLALSVTIPALVVEGKRGTAALSRSWELVLAHFWHALGTLALAYLVIIGIGIVVGIIGSASDVLLNILNIAVQLVTLPFFSLVFVSLYLNLRVRSGGVTQAGLREELARNA